MKSRFVPWRPAVLLAFSALLVGIPASASASSAAVSNGWVSLGNLSQTPSPVDVYLYSAGNSSPQFVQHDVAYGTILPYQSVSAGDYSVKVRTAGSSASSNPVWSVSLTVKAGGAYTVVPLRTSAQQGQLKVIDDDLTTPSGKSIVRVIQADLDLGQVTFHCSCAPGAPGNITTDAAPGTVSPPAPIPTGTWTMTATGPSATSSLPITLTAGTVHTEIVIAAPGGGLQIINEENAAGPARHLRAAFLRDSAAPRRTAQAHQYCGWRSSPPGRCSSWAEAGSCAGTGGVGSAQANDVHPTGLRWEIPARWRKPAGSRRERAQPPRPCQVVTQASLPSASASTQNAGASAS